MDIFLICVAAFLAAGLTLFSGFGLGTILMPVVAVFFPVPVAVAITAMVHLLNNFFKLALLWRKVNLAILRAFGIPALLATIPGALWLDYLARLDPFAYYQWGNSEFIITPVKSVVGLLLIIFATAEWVPFLNRLAGHRLGLPLGGILSGFFGGLSGHQGAFRSAFLIKAGLDKDSFVATNAAIAALVDIVRIIIYGLTFELTFIAAHSVVIAYATTAAFLGVYLATRLLQKVTIRFLQGILAAMLYGLGALLCIGMI